MFQYVNSLGKAVSPHIFQEPVALSPDVNRILITVISDFIIILAIYIFDLFLSLCCLFGSSWAPPFSMWMFTTHTDNSKLTGPINVEGLPGKSASSFDPNLPLNKSQIYEHVSRRNPALIRSFQAQRRNSERDYQLGSCCQQHQSRWPTNARETQKHATPPATASRARLM